MPRPSYALLSLALPALLAAAPPPACIVYGNGDSVAHLADVAPHIRKTFPPDVPAGVRVGFVYKYFHLWWIPVWTYDGAYALYEGDRYMPLTPEEFLAITGKTQSDFGKPFFYRFPLGLLILAGILLVCAVGALVKKRTPAPQPLSPGQALDRFVPERPTDPAHFCLNQLYQPDEVLRIRIPSAEDFSRFCLDVERAVTEFTWSERHPGQALSLFVAVRPGGRTRFWLEFKPDGVPQESKDALLRRLEAVRPPEVRAEVAMASYSVLWGGPAERNDLFAFVPKEWAEALGPAGGRVPDDALRRAWPEGPAPAPARGEEGYITDPSAGRKPDDGPGPMWPAV